MFSCHSLTFLTNLPKGNQCQSRDFFITLILLDDTGHSGHYLLAVPILKLLVIQYSNSLSLIHMVVETFLQLQHLSVQNGILDNDTTIAPSAPFCSRGT